ncbi:hypothetical protein WJX77_001794 [Trebouxia sp. C0004]
MLASENLEECVSTSQPTKLANSLADICKLFWQKAGHKISHPLGVKPQHVKYVRVVGQVGFMAKGVVYALIGGLSCQSAIQGATTIRGADNSPQGAFILVGNNQFGYPLLIVMALTVYMYACWRFWEGITGQGSDDAFGTFKNFFKYRLSPLVSGCVYTAYGAFCISLIPRIKHLDTAARSGGFPQSVAGSWWGDIIICIMGLAFLIAFVTQMQAAFTRNFHYEMKEDLPVWFAWSLIVTGHIGFLGRSGVFLFVAILMFRTIANPNINSTDETTIGNALSQLQKTHAGKACLFILGFFLIVYGSFAVLNSYGKVFPTQPPSGRPVREAQPQQGSWEHHTDQPDVENQVESKRSIGEPAWNHSESKKRLHLEQIQAEAVAGGSGPTHPQLGTSDYDSRRQERMQAIKDLEMTVLGIHPHGSPKSSPDRVGSARHHHMSSHDLPITQRPQVSVQQVPALNSGLAEIRLSSEDMASHGSAPVMAIYSSTHNGEMVDILLTSHTC